MTDKEKIRAEIERLKKDWQCYLRYSVESKYRTEAYSELIDFIDSLSEEPVSEKKCMFTKDSYTDEDRKVLCDGCEEECEYAQKKEPVSDIDFEQELYKAFGQVKDFTLGMQIAKRFYEMGKQHQEPVSEDLEKIVEEIAEPTILNAYGTKELAKRLRNTICGTSVSEDLEEVSKEWLSPQLDKSYAAYGETKQMELTHFDGYAMLDAIEFGAKWQKEQMMKDAIDGLVYAQRTDGKVMFRSNYVKKEGFEFGDKVKVIVIKEG